MEGIGAKKMMMSLLVLMMIVLAQGQDEVGFHEPIAKAKFCAKKCWHKCRPIRYIPNRIALCSGLCMLACHVQPSQVVYKSTSRCAHSMVNHYNPTDFEKVQRFVIDTCYEDCKPKNNN